MQFVNRRINIEADILVIDKPEEWTSQDVVAKIKGELQAEYGQKIKVGHGGTLDPFATGLLLVLVGKATKRFDEIREWKKEYLLEIKLGELTDTGDKTGKVMKSVKPSGSDPVGWKMAKRAVESFKGDYLQTVPAYSAVKIGGQRMYKLAREGKKVSLPQRLVKIYAIKLEEVDGDRLTVKVACSSGTYMRQLAVDIGEKLGLPAHALSLRRTRVGNFAL